MSIEILDCLFRERDVSVKTIITSQNTAFMWTPALIQLLKSILCINSESFLKYKFVEILLFLGISADPLVGSIAAQYVSNREEHDKTAREWTRRYAT